VPSELEDTERRIVEVEERRREHRRDRYGQARVGDERADAVTGRRPGDAPDHQQEQRQSGRDLDERA